MKLDVPSDLPPIWREGFGPPGWTDLHYYIDANNIDYEVTMTDITDPSENSHVQIKESEVSGFLLQGTQAEARGVCEELISIVDGGNVAAFLFPGTKEVEIVLENEMGDR